MDLFKVGTHVRLIKQIDLLPFTELTYVDIINSVITSIELLSSIEPTVISLIMNTVSGDSYKVNIYSSHNEITTILISNVNSNNIFLLDSFSLYKYKFLLNNELIYGRQL